jgi:peptidoglycan-associated lipoprotein
MAVKISHLHSIEGKVVDNITGRPIDDVKIRIESSRGRIYTLHTDARGDFIGSKDIIEGDNMYKLSFSKERYLTLSLSLSTYGINNDEYTLTDDGYLHTIHLIAEMDPMTSPVVLPRIEYDFDKATLRQESKKALDELVITLEENPDIVIELRSHTDHRGSDEYNIDLSRRRAASCVEYLISRGIAPHRLHSQGMGRSEPFVIPEYFESSFDAGTVLTEDFIRSLSDPALDEEARQYNRRTDFKVLGVAIEKPIITPYAYNESSKDSLIDDTASVTYVIDSLHSSDTESFQDMTGSNEPLFYTLKSGENYATVERLFNIPVSEIRRINGGLRGIMPHAGLTLKVSLTADYSQYDARHHRIERTETTLDNLLAAIGLSREEFTRLNPSYDTENIKAGDIIIISQ